jgi:hypothetical protein
MFTFTLQVCATGSRDNLTRDLIFLNGALPPDVKVTSIQASPSGEFGVHSPAQRMSLFSSSTTPAVCHMCMNQGHHLRVHPPGYIWYIWMPERTTC